MHGTQIGLEPRGGLCANLERGLERRAIPGQARDPSLAVSERLPELLEGGIALGQRGAQRTQLGEVLLRLAHRRQCRFARGLFRCDAFRQPLLDFPELPLFRLE